MKCPYCAEEIQEEAVKCKHCGEWLKKTSVLDNIKSGLHSTKSLATQLKDDIYGANHYYKPTDSTPFEIADLQLFDSFFILKNKKYDYTRITNLFYAKSNFTQSLNGLPMGGVKSNALAFSLDNFLKLYNPAFSIKAKTGTLILNIGLKEIKKIDAAYDILNEKATQNISKMYIKKLETDGFIQYGNVYIYNDGTIKKGDVSIDLKAARKNGGLFLGVNRYKSTNPFEILIKESNGWFATKIDFTANWDNGIIGMTLLRLSGALEV